MGGRLSGQEGMAGACPYLELVRQARNLCASQQRFAGLSGGAFTAATRKAVPLKRRTGVIPDRVSVSSCCLVDRQSFNADQPDDLELASLFITCSQVIAVSFALHPGRSKLRALTMPAWKIVIAEPGCPLPFSKCSSLNSLSGTFHDRWLRIALTRSLRGHRYHRCHQQTDRFIRTTRADKRSGPGCAAGVRP